VTAPESFDLTTPVALFVFNRPETTARVFEAVRTARPRRLFLVADGPRPDRPDEAQRCAAVRDLVERVDWPCQVTRDYAEHNLGSRQRVASGIGKVLEQVEEAILLEDDCVPHPTFFRFAQELLIHHRHDARVGVISGNNFQLHRPRLPASYAYSRYPLTWGWATWRRFWRGYDESLSRWPALREQGWLADVLGDPQAERHWTSIFDRVHRRELDVWDYQLTFLLWAESTLSILPAVNQVTNIGFGTHGTNTRDAGSFLADFPTGDLAFPLSHPAAMARDTAGDQAIEERIFSGPKRDWRSRLARRARKIRRGLGLEVEP